MILKNLTAEDISLTELGITIPAAGFYDLRYKTKEAIAISTELVSYVISADIGVLNANSPDIWADCWSISDALKIIQYGVNTTLLGIGDTHPGVVDGRLYSARAASTLKTSTIPADTLFAIPLLYPLTDWNRIGIEVVTSVVGAGVRMGIYANNSGDPGALLLDAGFVSTENKGLKEISMTFSNLTEWFWLACVVSAEVEMRSIVGDVSSSFGRTSTTSIRQVVAEHTYGPLPASFPSYTPMEASPPYIWLRKL
jgi:hypothetical protein